MGRFFGYYRSQGGVSGKIQVGAHVGKFINGLTRYLSVGIFLGILGSCEYAVSINASSMS